MRRSIHTNIVRLLLVLTPLVTLTGCPPPTPPPPCNCDLTVSSIEVTQAIQTAPPNTIQLVARRGTAVRAIIGVSGAGGPVVGVTGRLHVFVAGSEITPVSGVAPINSLFTAPLAPQRANENDSLNFELPAPTGITASPSVTFRVDITPMTAETNVTNNSLTTPNLSFVNRTTPSLFYTSINYTPSGLGLPNAALIAPGSGDLFVRGILPINDGDPNLYRQGLFPQLTYNEDANGDGRLAALGSDGNDLLSLLASCRQLIVNAGLGADNNTFLYGWLAGNPIDGNGLAQVGGRNAFGNTDVTRGQRSYAHELTHNFGLNHNNRNLDQVGWDVGARLNNNWAGNGVTGRVKPMTLFDIQAAGKLTNQAFVDTLTYNFLLQSPVLAYNELEKPRRGNLMLLPNDQQEKPVERVAVIQGIFDPSGEKLLRLKPVFRFPWLSQPTLRQPEARFIAEIVDDAGNVIKTLFSALVADDPDKKPEQEVNGSFEVMATVAPNREIVSVRITDAQGRIEFGGFKQSKPPELRIVAPQSGAQLGEKTEVVWEVRDPDTPMDQLMLQVAYSPNGGRNWVPIAVDIKGTEKSITFDSTQIQQSKENGIIRVFVSDGLNTLSADVIRLTAAAAKFPPP